MATLESAVADIHDGATILIGGLGSIATAPGLWPMFWLDALMIATRSFISWPRKPAAS